MNFGGKILGMRRKSGLSQAEVAQRMRAKNYEKYNQARVSRIESGKMEPRYTEALDLQEVIGAENLERVG